MAPFPIPYFFPCPGRLVTLKTVDEAVRHHVPMQWCRQTWVIRLTSVVLTLKEERGEKG